MAKTSAFKVIQAQVSRAKAEYQARRADLVRQLEQLDRDYSGIIEPVARGRDVRGKNARRHPRGSVQETISRVVAKSTGLKAKQIVDRTKFSPTQVYAALFHLQRKKQLKLRDHLYTAV